MFFVFSDFAKNFEQNPIGNIIHVISYNYTEYVSVGCSAVYVIISEARTLSLSLGLGF